jgi:hypothetical protein
MAPCCGQGYSTTPVACYSTVFHVFHDSDRVGTYCHGSGAAYETQVYCAQHPPPDDGHSHFCTYQEFTIPYPGANRAQEKTSLRTTYA